MIIRILSFLAISVTMAIPSPGQSPTLQYATPGLNEAYVQDGWLSLCDAQTLFGWTPVTKANWQLTPDGHVVVSDGQRGLLRTTSQFDDFEMVLEFNAGPRTNSGLFIRTSPDPKNVLRDCYEINIAPPSMHDFSTGAIVGREKTTLEFAPEQWHQMRILADGSKIKVWVDDQKTVDYDDPQPLGRGYIGLQYNSGPVAFRNLAIKPINQQVLFDGSDLEQWNQDQALESSFQIEEGQLRVTGGRGQLESRETFADFVLTLQCKTNADGLNSGVFYRCIPGEVMNGYESQIQNQFKDDDPTQPVDCGTGGIFRRHDARLVAARDQQWFRKTIVTTGPHVSVWVNGFQVSDWTDTRKPDANPRKGYRAEAGTFALQGHDPTTDLLFRDIRVRELAPRRSSGEQ